MLFSLNGALVSKSVCDALADISALRNSPAFCWRSGSAGTERAFLQSPCLKAEHTLNYLLIKNNSEKPNLQTALHGDFKSWLIIMLQLICPLILYHWHEDFWDCRVYEHHQNGASFSLAKPKGQQRAHMYLSLLGQESVRFQIHSHISTFQDINAFNMLNLAGFPFQFEITHWNLYCNCGPWVQKRWCRQWTLIDSVVAWGLILFHRSLSHTSGVCSLLVLS